MAQITIRELPVKYYGFDLDGVRVLDNRRNDMTVDSKRVPGSSFAHFKTSEGASIFEKQNVLPTDVTVIDIDNNSYSPTDMDQLIGYLEDINFYDWQTNYGGGGTSGNRFDELEDTFSYPGKQGFVARVNASETGLEAVPFYNYELITQHADWGDQNPLQIINNGKRVVQGLVGGVPKLILADDTANAPTLPNALLNDFTPTNVEGNNWVIPADRLWRINGDEYSDPLPFDFSIDPAATGKIRQDIIYVTNNNNLHFILGTEGDVSAPVPQTPAPANSIIAVTFTVTDGQTTPDTNPAGPPYITKESMMRLDVYSTGTYELPWTNKTRIDFYAPGTVTGFSNDSDAPGYDLNYDGQMFYLRNSGSDEVLLQNEGSGGIPFWFPDLSDHLLPDSVIWTFKFNKVANRMEYVGDLSSSNSNSTYINTFQWDGSPIEVPDGFVGAIRNLNDIYASVEYDPDVSPITITSGAYENDILMIYSTPSSPPPPEGRTVDNTIDLTVI